MPFPSSFPLRIVLRRLLVPSAFMLFFLLGFSPVIWSRDAGSWHLSNEFFVTGNDISGPGSDSSTLTQGVRYHNQLDVNGSGEAKGVGYRLNLGVRMTDDDRSDPQSVVPTAIQGHLVKGASALVLGDSFEYFSQYVLSSALKGVAYKRAPQEKGMPGLTLTYGFPYGRWDNAFDFGVGKVDSTKREVMGARLHQRFGRGARLGLNFVAASDSDRVLDTEPLYDQNLYGIDWEFRPLRGLALTGESTVSDTQKSPAKDAAEIETTGSAHKVDVVANGGPSRVKLSYERISPDFLSVTGAATADREKVKGSWRMRVKKRNSLKTSFLWFRDNLDGDQATGTHRYRPYIGYQMRRLFGRRYASAEVSYQLNLSREENKTTTRRDHLANVNYRDRFGRLDADTNLGYSVYEILRDSASERDEWTYNATLSTRKSLGDVILKPSLYLGGWRSDEELVDTTDEVQEYALGLALDIPSIGVNASVKGGTHALETATSGDTDRVFGVLYVSYRPQNILFFKRTRLFLRGSSNDFQYADGNRDFREGSITIGINTQI